MPDLTVPILERIARNIEQTLKEVRVSGGYFNDLIVERRRGRGNTVRDRLAVLHQGNAQTEEGPSNYRTWLQEFWVEVFVCQSETATAPTDEVINTIRADVERALMVDPRRGENQVHDTIIRSALNFETVDGSAEGVTVAFDVRYRTNIDDPYN